MKNQNRTTFVTAGIIAVVLVVLGVVLIFYPAVVTDNSSLPVEKNYVSESLEECQLIKFMCVEGMKPFFDDKGCGCMTDEDYVPADMERFNCTVRSEICTQEYAPVCGWFNSSIQCIKYPCAVTAGNSCGACANPSVEYYTIGECPAG